MLITGFVSEAEPGADLNPFNDLLPTPGVFEVGQYKPPTQIGIEMRVRRTYNPGTPTNAQDVYRWKTDLQLRDMGGNQAAWINAEWYIPENNRVLIGTIGECSVSWNGSAIASTALVEVYSQLGAILRVIEYEPGPTGIMTVSMTGGEPVLAYRRSDNTEQVLAQGMVRVPAGRHKLQVSMTHAATLTDGTTHDDIIMLFEPELPYGL